MNQKEWSTLNPTLREWKYYHCVKRIQKSLKYNSNSEAVVIHHLRDTEEQRSYNDTYYEYWGCNLDGSFEYGKYVVFVTKEEHTEIHKCSEETRYKMSKSRIGKKNPMYGRTGELSPHFGKHRSDETKKKLHDLQVGEKSYWYGKHHSEETKAKLSLRMSGENNPFYGKHHSEETKRLIGENTTKCRTGCHHSDDTKNKIREAQLGEKNHNYGKKTPDNVINKMKLSHQRYSSLYKEYKSNGGLLSWNEFQKAVKAGEL